MDPVGILAIFVGGVVCIFGYRIFQDALPLWGAVTGAAFSVYLSTIFYPLPGGVLQITVPQAVAAGIGALLGLLMARYIPFVIVFMTGAVLGGLLANFTYPLLMRGQTSLVVVILAAAVAGLLAVRFQELVMIVATAFLGALGLVYGIYLLVNMDVIWLAIIFFILGFGGAAAQYKDAHP